MVVATGFDLHVGRYRIRAFVALARVVEADAVALRLLVGDGEGNPVRMPVPDGAEVGMEPDVQSDRAENRLRVGSRRQLVDRFVPDVGGRKDRALRRAGQARTGSGARARDQ